MPDNPFRIALLNALYSVVDEKELNPQQVYDNYLKDLNRTVHDDFIHKFRSELLKLLAFEDTGNRIVHGYYRAVDGHLKGISFQRIYNTLIHLAKWKPLNNIEDNQALCPIGRVTILPENIVTVSTGYRYDIEMLKMSKRFIDPFSGHPFCSRDINRISNRTTAKNILMHTLYPLMKISLFMGCIAFGIFLASIGRSKFIDDLAQLVMRVGFDSLFILAAGAASITYGTKSLFMPIRQLQFSFHQLSVGPDEQPIHLNANIQKSPAARHPMESRFFSNASRELNTAELSFEPTGQEHQSLKRIL